MNEVPEEVAKADIERFLTALRVDPLKRKKMANAIDDVEELVQYGLLIVTDSNQLDYQLIEPILDDEGEVMIGSLKFKNKRVRLDSLEKVKNATEESYMRDMLALMTGEASMKLKKLTLDDMAYLEKIGMFFLPAQ